MGAFLFLLLAGTIQSIRGRSTFGIFYYDETQGNHLLYYNESGEYFPYQDYYDSNSTYDYFNYSGFEEIPKKNDTGSGELLLPSYCLFFSTALLHVLHFLQEDLRM